MKVNGDFTEVTYDAFRLNNSRPLESFTSVQVCGTKRVDVFCYELSIISWTDDGKFGLIRVMEMGIEDLRLLSPESETSHSLGKGR